ncbi:helicase associated domain-containing protein [Streptomyces sp. NBC_01320]|uniref:helicase associated domain-containing protein n=1 Tax=Streptomyces sp. NBC_01320 TaxID=2903824 RepID=UPI002E1577DA|nr:helicase associated domain-containing protein [Streptomyces sp. NBC_01320]WSK01203.1 helicase associated domain-containing protein [Streptomyces sp. NBC_01320]
MICPTPAPPRGLYASDHGSVSFTPGASAAVLRGGGSGRCTKTAAEEEKARQRGEVRKDKSGRTPERPRPEKNGDVSGAVAPLGRGGRETSCTPQKTAAQTNAKTGAEKDSATFTRGVAALQQYIAREGKIIVARQHVEELPDGTSVRLGIFLTNQKTRRHRLTEDQLATLAALGLGWAQ